MNSGRSRAAGHAAAFVIALTSWACSAGGGDEAIAEARLDSLLAAVEMEAEEPFDEDPLPLLPGEGEPREFNLLLVNRLGTEAYVFASAGASRVALDTVPRGDSVFVDIRLRSDHVDLEAEDGSGQVVSTVTIDLVRSQINRWEMTNPARRPVALRTRSAVLVERPFGETPRN